MSQPLRWREVAEVAAIALRRARAVLRLGPPTTGVAIVVTDDAGRTLLVQTRYRRSWGPPGGFIKPGELPEAAARRELEEEVGITEIALTPRGQVSPTRRTVTHVTHIFAGHAQPDAVTGRSWEIRASGWYGSDALPELSRTTRAIVLDPAH